MFFSSNNIRVGFLASHGGSAFKAIMERRSSLKISLSPSLLITNNHDALALSVAASFGVPAFVINKATTPNALIDDEICQKLIDYETDLVILAGYMKKIGPHTLQRFRGRIINSHPALLPKFGGQGMYGRTVHESVIRAQEKVSGVTIHIVDSDYDTGPILYQKSITLAPDETALSLETKIKALEPEAYLAALEKLVCQPS